MHRDIDKRARLGGEKILRSLESYVVWGDLVFPPSDDRSDFEQMLWVAHAYSKDQIRHMHTKALRILDGLHEHHPAWDPYWEQLDILWLALHAQS